MLCVLLVRWNPPTCQHSKKSRYTLLWEWNTTALKILCMYCTCGTECLKHTPGSHSVCAVRKMLRGVDQKAFNQKVFPSGENPCWVAFYIFPQLDIKFSWIPLLCWPVYKLSFNNSLMHDRMTTVSVQPTRSVSTIILFLSQILFLRFWITKHWLANSFVPRPSGGRPGNEAN